MDREFKRFEKTTQKFEELLNQNMKAHDEQASNLGNSIFNESLV